MIECWRCGTEYDEEEGFCPECDADIEPDIVYKKCGANCGDDDECCLDCDAKKKDSDTTINNPVKKTEYTYILKYKGVNTEPPLYTGWGTAHRIKHKATGKVYTVGKMQAFYADKGQIRPPVVEETNFFECTAMRSFLEGAKPIKAHIKRLTERKSFDGGGINISYTKTYTKDKSNKSIIFVHGNGESGDIFAEVSQWLCGDYTVYCPDSRSHGLSGKVKQLNYADMAEDVVSLIKHENIEKPVLFGFSDGGIVGLLIAIKYPDLLSKLLVAGINLTPNGTKRSWRRLFRFCYFFTRSDKLRIMLTQPNITAADLKTIKTPTTVFYAEKDMVELADSQAIADNVSCSKLVVMQGENHGSYVLTNAKLYKLLKAHL